MRYYTLKYLVRDVLSDIFTLLTVCSVARRHEDGMPINLVSYSTDIVLVSRVLTDPLLQEKKHVLFSCCESRKGGVVHSEGCVSQTKRKRSPLTLRI